jgi:asparagine synthase (glutamine-hydrolysing)
MCGVAGLLRRDGGQPDASIALAMIQALHHRGPDDTGAWRSGEIALGNSRLSIIGIDRLGHQPLTNEDGSVVVTYNGEIYNYRELRRDLQDAGHIFKSATDTEVLVHAYEQWGVDHFLDRINGMFAFALWDEPRRRLVLARDRLGVKRLYVRVSDKEVAFASEIGALLIATPDRSIDADAVDAYFALGYVPEPATIWASIKCLPAGAIQVWDRDGVRQTTYWHLRENALPVPTDPREAAKVAASALGAAVRRQLVSDVPVGLFLSGGLDSLAIAALAAQESNALLAFTVGFGEVDFDESARASRVAAYLNLDHRVEVLRPDAWSTIASLARHFAQPFADSSAVAVSLISSAAARDVKVVLTGDGGDELFAGYETYSATRLASLYARLPRLVRVGTSRVADELPVSHGRLDFGERARRFTRNADRPAAQAHAYWREYFSPTERARLLTGSSISRPGGADRLLAPAIETASAFHGLNRFLAFDTISYLPSDMLYKLDVATMWHSIEARVPFLDHEFVELAFSLDPNFKRRGAQGKRVLREALKTIVPAELTRGSKRGFNVPVARWLAGPLKSRLAELLDPGTSSAMRILNADYVNELMREHASKRRDHSYKLWAVMIFAIWYESANKQP